MGRILAPAKSAPDLSTLMSREGGSERVREEGKEGGREGWSKGEREGRKGEREAGRKEGARKEGARKEGGRKEGYMTLPARKSFSTLYSSPRESKKIAK